MTGLILQIIGLDNEDFVIHFYIERDKMLSFKKSELVKVYPKDGVKYYALIDGLERGHLMCRVEIVDHEAFWSDGKRPVVISGYTGYDIGLCGGEGKELRCGDYKVSFDAVQNIPKSDAVIYYGIGDLENPDIKKLNGIKEISEIDFSFNAGESVVVAIPKDRGLAAKKDNGFGGRIEFSEKIKGANGRDITLNGLAYKIYGEFMVVKGNFKVYIE